MKKRVLTILTGIVMSLIAFQSCEKKEENETKISSYNSTESLNMELNCMSCHKSGGTGEGWFTIAGTVYDSLQTSIFPNATVKLYTNPNGTGNLKATIQVDKYGNFYTTEIIDFGNGLYPLVEGNVISKYMISSIASGQCNSCHGVSSDLIWSK